MGVCAERKVPQTFAWRHLGRHNSGAPRYFAPIIWLR